MRQRNSMQAFRDAGVLVVLVLLLTTVRVDLSDLTIDFGTAHAAAPEAMAVPESQAVVPASKCRVPTKPEIDSPKWKDDLLVDTQIELGSDLERRLVVVEVERLSDALILKTRHGAGFHKACQWIPISG